MRFVSPNFSDVLEPNIAVKQFPDGDNYVCLPGVAGAKGKEAVLLHRLWPEQDRCLVQALLMLSALRKAGAKSTLVSPYLPYARQDKIFKDGEALSAEEVCRMLKSAGAGRLVTLDCHFLKKEGESEYGGLRITNISMAERLIAHAKGKLGGDGAALEVISPDVGASYMVAGHGGKSMKKVRGDYAEGKEAYRKIESVEMGFGVKGKNVLILDDMISTGGTMLRAVENVRKGGAKKVLCAATHGFFLSGSLEKLKAVCDHVFVTDSVPTPVSEVKMRDALRAYVD